MADSKSNVQATEQDDLHDEHQQQEPEAQQQTEPETDQPAPPPEPESDENQFSRLMRERRAAKAAAIGEPVKDEPPADRAPTSESEGEPADEPPSIETKDDQGKQQDWFASLPEEARAQMNQQQQYLEHLQQSYRALHGRLAPMQRQNEDLRKRLQELEARPTPTLKDLEEHHAWKDISTELPEEAGELKQVFTSQAQALQQAQQRQDALNQAIEEERQDRLRTELRRLAVRHPNFEAVRSNPLFSQWRQAVESNPQAYPDVVQKLRSPYYEDISDVLDKFRGDLQEAHPQEHAQLYGFAQQQRSSPQGQQRQPQGQRVQRPKPPSPSPPSQGSGVSGAQRQRVPMTEQQAFSEYLRQKRRR